MALNETALDILQQLRDLDLSRPDAFTKTINLETAFKMVTGRQYSPLDMDAVRQPIRAPGACGEYEDAMQPVRQFWKAVSAPKPERTPAEIDALLEAKAQKLARHLAVSRTPTT